MLKIVVASGCLLLKVKLLLLKKLTIFIFILLFMGTFKNIIINKKLVIYLNNLILFSLNIKKIIVRIGGNPN